MYGNVSPHLLAEMDDELVQRIFVQHSEISGAEKNMVDNIQGFA
jgi:hypothetical protein